MSKIHAGCKVPEALGKWLRQHADDTWEEEVRAFEMLLLRIYNEGRRDGTTPLIPGMTTAAILSTLDLNEEDGDE